jgi:hypothetical protein
MTTQQANTNQVTENSNQPAPTADTSALTIEVQKLEASAGRYNTASVGLLYAAGLVAVLIAVVAYRSGRVNSQLREIQNQLLHAKDEQLARDLKAKEEQIAATKKDTVRIEAESGEKIAALATEAEALSVEAEKAKAERAEADKQIAIAKENAAKASERTAGLSLRVEEEARKRVEAELRLAEIQERLRPRTFTPEQRAQLLELFKANVKGSLSNIQVPINDPEAVGFAQKIKDILVESGWTVGEIGFATFINARGIIIQVHSVETAPP